MGYYKKTIVGIPVFGSRVAPRFDCASKMLILEIEKGKLSNQKEINLSWQNPLSVINQMRSMAINVLICGAIPCFWMRILSGCGIKVISWVSGEWQEAFDLFLKGKLINGWPWHCRHRRRKGWRHKFN
ncbi:MAG TPA: hypothetical protein ENF30_00230 [Candidatus Desulfofervidus auxilii]|uniref:Dinitrogenase iron-molybdenum cofactor biosynthesis domain-containing protein n=1 Tax=Desulfofervidus auxilii TaxID=1621989 RepID=A0A7V0I9K1_DESA2|nr:hypothetical protein [Candidatus Desulfofervidus auxilii]